MPSSSIHLPKHAGLGPLCLAAGLATGLLWGCGGAGAEARQAAPGEGAISAPADPEASPGAPGGLVVVEPHHASHPGWRDLGTIPLGEVATYVVQVQNREGRPLTIQSMRAGCACTIPSIAYRAEDGQLVQGDLRSSDRVLTLPAGALADLTLRIDSRRAPIKNSPKRVNVRIVTDSSSDPYLTVEAQFTVATPFQVAPERVELGEVAENGVGQASTRLVQLADLTLVGVLDSPPGFESELERTYYLGGISWDLRVRVFPPIPLGFAEHIVTLSTEDSEGKEGPPFEVPVRVTGVPDTEVQPARLLLRPPALGAPHLAEVVIHTNLPGHRFQVSGPRIEGPGSDALEVELVPGRPDDALRSPSWTVRLHAVADLPAGGLAGTVTLETDDPALPEVVIPYLLLERS